MLRNNQLKAYFSRIGFKGQNGEIKPVLEGKTEQVKPTLELLTQLHELHVFSIPFENLSLHLNEDIHINRESIYDKLVTQPRGGYCYEMNGLFYTVLKTLGFEVELQLAEVSVAGSEFGSRKATHLILIVHLDGKDYLADVGFGRNGLIHPLVLEKENFKQNQIYSSIFEVKHDTKNGFIYGVHFNGKFNMEYCFDLPIKKNLKLSDLQEYSDAISRKSSFTDMILVSKPTKEGRKTLHNDMLKHLRSTLNSNKLIIDTFGDYINILASEFGIRVKKSFNFSNIPTLAEKMITQDVNKPKTKGVFPTSSAKLMYGKGNKLASGKFTLWSFATPSKNEPEILFLPRENTKYYR